MALRAARRGGRGWAPGLRRSLPQHHCLAGHRPLSTACGPGCRVRGPPPPAAGWIPVPKGRWGGARSAGAEALEAAERARSLYLGRPGRCGASDKGRKECRGFRSWEMVGRAFEAERRAVTTKSWGGVEGLGSTSLRGNSLTLARWTRPSSGGGSQAFRHRGLLSVSESEF